MEIIEKAPAKLNLFLDTPFRHPDGAPEWQMVMTAIDLADYVKVTPYFKNQLITVETDLGFLPQDQRNLAFQAAKILQKRFAINQGVQIKIRKKIPVAAGMGGGSADAAAVLRALNKLWNLELSRVELARIGLLIDSDVPFCVYSQTAAVSGKGEIIEPLPDLPPFWIVLAKPRASVSTAGVLKKIPYSKLGHGDYNKMLLATASQDLKQILPVMTNVLETVTQTNVPEILRLKHKMIEFGAQTAQMTGSGPTVFGICEHYSRAQHVYNSLKGFCETVQLVRPCHLHCECRQ
ncbi:MAG: 4-(cytidine 5'-diphospho)-2-C-methyl-D-erythritol kinase [Liquorilactobacillus nagelii]|jgi:4-diphosphocytidyl-2-C-methyl-D-erythritol kinase|uniref:4-diphosphocytidyl-2-C-methyl-D-erythritol kinase n=1 Tax=Liquorilactobacillus nagelii TaxID=82688 RepID=A0A3S6QTN4_9LACO|nr:4-(cytidine 5'-diphospho)-2-C-methyl-D-erythritol kinase [Liquorilactobacillus nagelii]AUJ31398.1 4-(cytidine 5'-diphospho)-2-C-methyl-D-erythritol kinase [Liquorilactobacillus nagelii]MCC7617051.1 4-(cytidine 5'-diphospho)-2-C-methyl-D-erythritol kinase [Liquorilactobacillus nagelii]MCI1633400.1 4-(cytidine 5'-diphospho)-2-C-methyl-D-erythritol kinase [Liquorilactobacillus nagelii]MCI1700120.1 4-(cytidine 5'-diphospho)-2-C-methyl-D-erythritol kinase [Liquorilactobacillus nagelii]MCI1922213